MAEIRTVTTLRSKRAEIQAAIASYEHKLHQARADLSHITAAIAIFEASGERSDMAAYVNIHRVFKYGEASALCKEALAYGPKSTPELALYVMAAKGLDTGDKVLCKSLAFRLIHAMRSNIDGARLRMPEKSKVGAFGGCHQAARWRCQ